MMLVLGAAVLHASWNAILKSGADRNWTMTALSIGMGIAAAIVLPFVDTPALACWPYLFASVAIHVGYNLLLVRMYEHGYFGQTYPVARGSSPVLIALGAFLLAGENLSIAKLAGVCLVSGGIIALALQNRHLSVRAIPTALATGVAIAAYSLVDGLGVRVSDAPLGYSAWMFVLWAMVMTSIYLVRRGARSLVRSPTDMLTNLGGGIVAGSGYTAVIWAMSLAPMGLVSALRETSVIFAAIIARVFLKEQLSTTRLAACVVIAAGAALLA